MTYYCDPNLLKPQPPEVPQNLCDGHLTCTVCGQRDGAVTWGVGADGRAKAVCLDADACGRRLRLRDVMEVVA